MDVTSAHIRTLYFIGLERKMYRNIINDLTAWQSEEGNRILYVKGAYGVGKTWAVKDFATAYFDAQNYVDLSVNTGFRNVIAGTKEPDDEYEDSILLSESDIRNLSIETRLADVDFLLEQHFDNADISKCILIFDEVQCIPDCAEFFHEYKKLHPDYTICLIASTMEITEYEYLHPDVFDIIRMRPMTFEEYMIANQCMPLIAAIEDQKSTPLSRDDEEKAIALLRDYLLVGGMPGPVSAFIKSKNYDIARKKQLEILDYYETLIRKSYSFATSQRCRRIWSSIPKQLTNDNKKFMYRYVEENARSREYSQATYNLCNLGLARKLPRLKSGDIPLEDNADYKSYEFFLIDHGLLRALYELPCDGELTARDILCEKNGAIAEQYVFQELSEKVGYLYYWVSGATARVPFVYEGEENPIPVDIRINPNKKAQNIKTFKAKNPNAEISIKISLEQVSLEGSVLNIPAYGLWNM